jgi:acyl-coenzyme A thioesterase PaaI-like protein
MKIRLHNEDWGIETRCFVCEPTNDRGLQIPFFHDIERSVVTADFKLDFSLSGAPTVAHGGVTLAILDESMAWACIVIAHQWAVTSEINTRFHQPIYVDKPYRVEAAVIDRDESTLRCSATILDHRDTNRVEATASFTMLGEAEAVRFGADARSDDPRGYLRD